MKVSWDEHPIISETRRDQTFQGTFTGSPRFTHGELRGPLRVPLKGPLRAPVTATLIEPEPVNTALAKPGGTEEDVLPRP